MCTFSIWFQQYSHTYNIFSGYHESLHINIRFYHPNKSKKCVIKIMSYFVVGIHSRGIWSLRRCQVSNWLVTGVELERVTKTLVMPTIMLSTLVWACWSSMSISQRYILNIFILSIHFTFFDKTLGWGGGSSSWSKPFKTDWFKGDE